MPRHPDLPCSTCGRLMWSSATSLPEGQATCRPCRRKARGRGPTESAPKRVSTWKPEARECPICGTLFTQDRYGQVYCSSSCRESRRNWSYATKAATAEERGYGKAHREERARWKPIVDSGQATCCICGYWIEPGSTWHLDHTEDRTGYRGAAHAVCNQRDGASRGARRVNARRRPTEKVCPACHCQFSTVYPKQTYCSAECRKTARAKPKPPPAPRYCEGCGARIKQGKRCAPCRTEFNREYARTYMRNRYRKTKGIPLDAPLYRRAS